MRIVALLIGLFALLGASPALAQDGEASIRATIAGWYAELAKAEVGYPERHAAPGFINASPYYQYRDTGTAALGPRFFTSLSATALQFRYDIDSIEADSRFAKVRVWERGYFYAPAAQATYERAASTLFLLERQPDGRWLIIAHKSASTGIPPNRVTHPMPDLRAQFERNADQPDDPQR